MACLYFGLVMPVHDSAVQSHITASSRAYLALMIFGTAAAWLLPHALYARYRTAMLLVVKCSAGCLHPYQRDPSVRGGAATCGVCRLPHAAQLMLNTSFCSSRRSGCGRGRARGGCDS